MQKVDPVQWPLLQIATDRGSDGVSALQYAQRKEGLFLNIDTVYDQSHDVTNDIDNAIAKADLKPHSTVAVGTWDVPHGPWSEDTR